MSSGKHYKRRDFIGSLAGTGLALSLGRCRQSSTPDSGDPAGEFEKAHWIIGFSNASEMNTWRTALREAIEQETDKYDNVDLIITDAQESPAKQIADLEDLLARGVSGLIIGPVSPFVANPILEECHREEIPTVIVDRKVSSDKYTTFVSSDQSYMATNVLEKLIELIGNAGEIAIVEGIPGAGPAVERNAAYDAVLEKYPAISAVRQAGDWSRASGQRVTENIITANPDLKGIHFDGGEMALGGIQALREAGTTDEMIRSNRPVLTWLDGYNGGLKMIQAGLGKYAIQHPPRLHGSESVKALIKAFKGEPLPKRLPIAQAVITPENAGDYVALDKPDDYWPM